MRGSPTPSRRLADALLAALLIAAPVVTGGQERLADADKLGRLEAIYAEDRQAFPEVPAVAPADLAGLAAAGRLVLVDVRTPAEQAVSQIAGAITAAEFEQRRAELAGAVVVTYCTIGYRSGLYAERLRAEGWDARNLAGSLLAWTHAGGELVDPEGQPTKRLHVYGERWDLAAAGYETVW
ncbi:MAG: rhodanese-like domain-containing protein [Thermoanaerobaculia bacterium]